MTKVTKLIKQAIAEFGTEAKLAEAVGCSQPAINVAKQRGRVGPQLAIGIDRATEGRISKSALRPDLWEPVVKTRAARKDGRGAAA